LEGRYFILNEHKVFFEELPDLISQGVAKTTFEQSLFDFMYQWRSGQEAFNQLTSGSTGLPKSIRLSRNMMLKSAHTTLQTLNWTGLDTALLCVHTDFIAGKMMVVRALEAGMLLIATEPDANPLMNLPARLLQVISVAAMVPLQLESILKQSPELLFSARHLKDLLLGGAPVSGELLRKVQKVPFAIWHTYGMTETCSHIALRRLNGDSAQENYQVLPGVKLSTDERGCLVIEGEVCYEGRVVTNDLVELLDERQFKWSGRVDRVINSGGIKINLDLLEEETANLLHAAQLDLLFFYHGLRDEILGEKLIMVVQSHDPTHHLPLLEMALSALPKLRRPKQLLWVEKMTITNSGKIDRINTLKSLGITA
jgi:O-succinylbenzoic acid--CoA ligase